MDSGNSRDGCGGATDHCNTEEPIQMASMRNGPVKRKNSKIICKNKGVQSNKNARLRCDIAKNSNSARIYNS